MDRLTSKQLRYRRRRKHVRKNVIGTDDRLRLNVFRSGKHMYAQIINDNSGETLVQASTIDKELKERVKPDMKKTELSKLVGEEVAKRALDKNIKKVVFDRNGFLYHGRIKALADAARKGGLDF